MSYNYLDRKKHLAQPVPLNCSPQYTECAQRVSYSLLTLLPRTRLVNRRATCRACRRARRVREKRVLEYAVRRWGERLAEFVGQLFAANSEDWRSSAGDKAG